MHVHERKTSSEDTQKNPLDRLLIIDDDICFGALMSAVAPKQGFEPRFFPSLVDMGSFARIKDFDIAVIDYFLGHLRGDEIAEYVDTFFEDIPVVIVSAEESLSEKGRSWPESVRTFIPKSAGVEHIMEVVRNVLKRDRMLKRLRNTTHDPILNHGS